MTLRKEFNTPTPRQISLFVNAGRDAHRAYMEKFLKKFGDSMIDVKNFHGRTALIMAAGAGYHEMAYFSLGKGANVNAADNEGRTPLMAAAIAGRINMVYFLMNRGAEHLQKDAQGLTAVELAIKAGHADTAKIITDVVQRREAAERLKKSAPKAA